MWTASIAYGLSLALAVAASPLRDPQHVLSSPSPRDTPTAPIAGLRVAHTARTPYYDPRTGGGHQYNRNLWGAHEPLNIIISARSSADVLKEQGLIAYSRSLGLWNECANLHLGDPQVADLGDGKGWERELFVMRESVWPFPWVGSCLETITGGNHFRAYKQNGTEANSGAWFLAASKEVDLRGKHKIAHDGYNLGRNLLVEKATGGSSYLNRRYEARVEWVEDLLDPGSEGMAHGIAQDGRVAILTVTVFRIF
ncbi:hypothetical protein JCM8202_006316 [Rhodotorula sphaerocarpa]